MEINLIKYLWIKTYIFKKLLPFCDRLAQSKVILRYIFYDKLVAILEYEDIFLRLDQQLSRNEKVLIFRLCKFSTEI